MSEKPFKIEPSQERGGWQGALPLKILLDLFLIITEQ
jgi:hypothetical protein